MRSHVESVAKAMFGVFLTLVGCSPTGVDQTTQAPITNIARDTPPVCRVNDDGSLPAGLAIDTCTSCTTEWEFGSHS